MERFTGNACPVCGIPSYHRDVHTNRQMDLATSLCQRLSALLSQADTPLPAQHGNTSCSTSISCYSGLVVAVQPYLLVGLVPILLCNQQC